MGDYDVVKAVLGRVADMTWMQIAIKPAKPFAFGKIDGTPVFGLPGNPASVLKGQNRFGFPTFGEISASCIFYQLPWKVTSPNVPKRSRNCSGNSPGKPT